MQVVHGGKEQVDALLDHPDVRAVSFVGSAPVAKRIYRKAADGLKRVQALAGAKNHLVVMPDANKEQAIASLVGASCGAAGQRCMAISAAVLVGAAAEWLPDVKTAMAGVRPRRVGRRRRWLRRPDHPRRARAHSGLHRARQGGRRDVPPGRQRLHGARLPERQLDRPDAFRRRDARDVHLHGGDLRPGAGDVHRADARRRPRAGERQSVRQRCFPLHRERRRGAQVPARGAGGPGRHQHSHPGAAAVLLLHGLEELFLRRLARLRQAGRALLHRNQDRDGALVSTTTAPPAPT